MKNSKNISQEEQFKNTLYVELLFKEKPVFDTYEIYLELADNCGECEVFNDSPQYLVFGFPSLGNDGDDMFQSPQVAIEKELKIVDVNFYKEPLSQTWDWPDKEKVLRKCRYKIMVCDFLSTKLNILTRLQIFNKALASIISCTSCVAIHWVNSMRLISPEAFLEKIKEPNNKHLFGPLNIRSLLLDNMHNEYVMDTLGLGTFNLPDFQIHYKNLKFENIFNLLTRHAYNIFNNGNTIRNGHTLRGITTEQRWTCQYEHSLLTPDRLVIDLNPGAPFAAGDRE